MIPATATLSTLRLPLCRLIVTEYQPRYFARLKHGYDQTTMPEHADSAPD